MLGVNAEVTELGHQFGMAEGIASRESSCLQNAQGPLQQRSGLESVFRSLCVHLEARDETDSSGASLYGDHLHRPGRPAEQVPRALSLHENALFENDSKVKGALLQKESATDPNQRHAQYCSLPTDSTGLAPSGLAQLF
jgi:hypothetical protein